MIITRVVNEATVVLTLEGRLDSAWSEPTAVALDDAIRLGRARVELDLSAVTFISSVGIGVLLRASTKLRAVGGGLAVKSASVVVREMLRASKLEAMFALAPLVAVAHTKERSLGRGWNGSLVTLDATPSAQQTVFSRIDEGHLRVDASTLAIGHLALALDSDSARGLYGDGLAAGGTIALAPAHSPRPDCLAASDGHTIECMARTALVARGAFAFRGRFEGTSEQPVALSSLALELLHAVGGPFAFVAIGECAGAFGAWARQSPDAWRTDPAHMNNDELRIALGFAGERMHVGETMTAVAFVFGDQTSTLATLDLHAHLAVTSYRPVPQSTNDPRAAGSLLAEQPLRSVMHALSGRDGLESAFVRGCCWVMPIGAER